MKVIAVINKVGRRHNEIDRLVTTLKDKGYTLTGVTVDRPELLIQLRPEDNKSNKTFPIPECLKSYRFAIKLNEVEAGGRNNDFGMAMVVCRDNGQRLRPFYRPIAPPFGPHGYFAEYHRMVTVTANTEGKVTITRFSYRRDGFRVVTLNRVVLWNGAVRKLDRHNHDLNSLSAFMPAVEAAREKAACERCRCLHYSIK